MFGDLLRFMSDVQQSNAADHMLDVKNIMGEDQEIMVPKNGESDDRDTSKS